jgi:hypothetical protein
MTSTETEGAATMNDNISTTGYRAAASTTGYRAAASTTGYRAAASTTGYRAAASTTGYRAAASTTGYRAAASTTGYRAAASTTGDWAAASTTGNQAAAACLGVEGWARAGVGGTIVLSFDDKTRRRVLVAYPGETEGITPNVWCHVVDGAIVADVNMLLPQDGRGYSLRFKDGRYLAGCRNFDAAEAIAHWSDPNHEAPESAALLLAAVAEHVAKLEAQS